uniref:NKAP domain containing 1 n=1 Tax=Labrus bergylta TaxID=56723 RepID=A0A3Q3GE84_9LABR
MAKQPLGKTLLRNVIRHTDAHNKIQEEMEMWKMRGWETQMSHHKHLSGLNFSLMNRSDNKAHLGVYEKFILKNLHLLCSHHRWGHSGFKELYPEEFDRDCERNGAKKKNGRHKIKKSESVSEASLSKRSKKSSRKKKKKKKKDEEGKRKKAECSSSSDDSSDEKEKLPKKRAKSRHKNKKTSKKRGKDEDSSSGDSNDEHESRTHKSKKRKRISHKDSDSGLYSKKKRKNWKAAGEECSGDSSAD